MIKKILKEYLNRLDGYVIKNKSPLFYLKFSKWVLPILTGRMPNKVKFKIENNYLICIIQGDQKYYFYNPYRARRYVFGDGFYYTGNSLARAYQVTNIKIDSTDVIVDIGANVGEFSVWAARKGAKVYSFEVDPIALNCLIKNTKNYNNITIVRKACSDKDGYAKFYLDSNKASSTLLKPSDKTNKLNRKNFHKVQTITLNKWLESQSINKIRLLKIDAEGYEPEVLKGIGDSITMIDYITVDASPERNGQETIDDVQCILKNNGFKCQTRGYYVLGINTLL